MTRFGEGETPLHCPECGCLIGEDTLAADQMRKRFFAQLQATHESFNEEQLKVFPTKEHLRKFALINAGHSNITVLPTGSSHAAAVARSITVQNGFSINYAVGDTVWSCSAKSIDRHTVKKTEFLELQQAVYNWIYKTTGIDPGAFEP